MIALTLAPGFLVWLYAQDAATLVIPSPRPEVTNETVVLYAGLQRCEPSNCQVYVALFQSRVPKSAQRNIHVAG